MTSDYIRKVTGVGRALGHSSAKHAAPQPGDVRPPSPRPQPPRQVVHMPTVRGQEPQVLRVAPPPQVQPGQPPPLADGVVRCRVEEIHDKGGELLAKLAVIACPGCGNEHGLWVWKNASQPAHPIWGFDGSLTAPTFSPSLLCFHTRPARDGRPAENVTDCHTFIKGGWIQFLNDSHAHQLRGWHKLPAVGD